MVFMIRNSACGGINFRSGISSNPRPHAELILSKAKVPFKNNSVKSSRKTFLNTNERSRIDEFYASYDPYCSVL